MIALAGPAGFYGAPVTKILLCHAILTYFLFTFPLQHFHHLFHYSQDVFAKRQFKKMLMSKLVFLDLPDLIFSSLLIYNFRIFERRFGSRKFISHLISTMFLASVLELLVFAVLNRLDIRLGEMPCGLMLFPLYVPFYCTVPRVALMRIMGVPVTGKTLNYILGLQMASAEVENMLVVGCAIAAGLLWKINFMKMQTLCLVPKTVGNTFDQCLGRFLESADSQSSMLPMGATVELQQRERLDRIEQQMMASALQASRRMEIGRPQPMNLAQGPGIFGNTGMFRNNGHNQQQQGVSDDSSSGESSETTVSEEQVQQFVEMGFSDARVRQALRSANNNPRLATNFLLQDM